jgi:hypothetical protein
LIESAAVSWACGENETGSFFIARIIESVLEARLCREFFMATAYTVFEFR